MQQQKSLLFVVIIAALLVLCCFPAPSLGNDHDGGHGHGHGHDDDDDDHGHDGGHGHDDDDDDGHGHGHDDDDDEDDSSRMNDDFDHFCRKYNRNYHPESEHHHRFNVFSDNMRKAKEYQRKNPLATFGITKFMDLTEQEFKQQYLMPPITERPPLETVSVESFAAFTAASLPTSFDWRNSNAVTPVKDQGNCSAGWAFSVAEVLESVWFLGNHSLTNLSIQQIVDCDTNDAGCGGGYPTNAYSYIKTTGGLESEASYPYLGADGYACAFQSSSVVASMSNWKYATTNANEVTMQQVLINSGPLSVCVAASTWQTYTGGVITSCDSDMNHCVQITGYGNMIKNGFTVPVWNIRNSWSTDWGVDGYIFVQRNKDMCDVAELVTVAML